MRIDVHHHFHGQPERRVLEAISELQNGILDMSEKLTAAIEALVAEAADSTTKLESIKTFIEGVPELVHTAVTEALAAENVADDAAAEAADAARTTISDKVDEALAAISTNTPDEPTA